MKTWNKKFTIGLILALIMALGVMIVALADQFNADADALAVDAPHGNGIVTIQNGGTTASYDFSAYVKETGNANDNVFKNEGDYVEVTITRSGDWAIGGTPDSFTFTTYNSNQVGTISITVPCDTQGTTKTMNVELSAVASNLQTLSSSSITLSYAITAGPNSPSCAPADNTAPTASPTQSPATNANGWNNTDVTVNWNWADNAGGSGIDLENCEMTTVAEDEGEYEVTATCYDLAGIMGEASYAVKIDKTAPTISGAPDRAANANGWYNADVTVSFTCNDLLSGIASCTAPATLDEGADQSVTGTATDIAGNNASATVSDINIDKTAPSASASALPAANANGWNNTDVTVSFSGADSLSGIDLCDAAVVLSSEGAGQSASGTCTDKAGNVSALATASGINIDKTAPTVELVGGPANGGNYYFGFVPAAPSCNASDALSGLDGACSVNGYSAAVGTHAVTASAADKAGNSASASATYTVLAWTLNGFYQPVDMNGVWNTVKGGSTVPFKFEIFAGATELKLTSYVIGFTAQNVACPTTGVTADEIEVLATGGTSLRFDTTGDQFIFNWQTPKKPGACYTVTMTTLDGSSLSANFKLK